MTIQALIVASVLAFIPTSSSVPNLCDDVYLGDNGAPIHDSTGVTLSRYCEWTGPGASVLNSEVCCELDDSGAACWLPDMRSGCSAGERYWCEHGEVDALGGVVCYQPLPDACEAGYCIAAPEDPPVGEPLEYMCCGAGGCFPIGMFDECGGEFVVCGWGISNPDGTVECFD